MKKFLVVFAFLLFVTTVSAEQKNLFASASVKKIDGVTAMVSGLDIQVKADADSLKEFIILEKHSGRSRQSLISTTL